MNYQIIMDKEETLKFIDFLPATKPAEKFYYCLFARSKYLKDEHGNNKLPHIKSDKAQLKRGVATKDTLFQKIQQLECPLGSYYQRTWEIPQEALALYITPNPRDLWKATKNSLKHFAEMVCTDARTNNPQAEAMSEIQRSKGTTEFVIFDIDTKEEGIVDTIVKAAGLLPNRECYSLIETRGGYHLLVRPSLVPASASSNWYKTIKTFSDQGGDIMVPVPGTYQGGFTPKLTI